MSYIANNGAERESELRALARLVMYARDSARTLGTQGLENALSEALEAVVTELQQDADGRQDSAGVLRSVISH